jgi:peptidyl-prolyl cis-trans isomerase SurA
VTHNIRRNLRGKAVRLLGWTALAAFSTGAIAQTVADQQVPDTNLNIPANLQIFGKLDPNVRKPTAIVNDTVITGTGSARYSRASVGPKPLYCSRTRLTT